MKVYIAPGHQNNDPGAVANGFVERELTLSIANACTAYLKKNGVTVKQSRTTKNGPDINERAAEANSWGADLVCEIHINAGGGDGFEVFHSVLGGTGKTMAKNIETEVKKIGQNSRGVKTKVNSQGTDYLGIIRLTKAPAVLVECAFIDNKKDMAIIDTAAEQREMGVAIAKGILNTINQLSGKSGSQTKQEAKKGYTGTFPTLPAKGYFASGASGGQVKNLQRFLNWAVDAGLDVDGHVGPKTISAVKKYQKKYGLTVDGMFGPASLAKAKTIKK